MSNSNEQVKDNWNANLYDQSHYFVSKYGNSLIELLEPRAGESILDLGCGTGDLTNTLFEIGVNVIGIDKSVNMIGEAINKYPHLQFNVQDATTMDYKNTFDAVFSNATLHWVHPPKKVAERIYKSLKSGGRFVAEFGGKGNVQIITNEIINGIIKDAHEFNIENNPWYFPSIGEYTSLMEDVGFRVTLAQHFDRPTPLVGEEGLKNWIRMFGSQLFKGIHPERVEHIITGVETALKSQLYDGENWVADYKRIRVIGVKQ
ncbi:MAG TPA: methyltransferase domain-containing protein [Ureibacillus sp.]|nr:methyltransferase domain-containing protein [Ureibacillus sp.]